MPTDLCFFCKAPVANGRVCSRPPCQWKATNLGASQKCTECASPLVGREAGVCLQSGCQQRVREREHARRRDQLSRFTVIDERGLELRSNLASALNLQEPERFPLTVIPAVRSPLVPVESERIEALTQHVRKMVEKSHQTVDDSSMGELPQSAPEQFFIQSACTLCEGRCCGNGANAGYIADDTIRRVRRDHPEWSDSEIIDQYTQRAAGSRVAGSCIYHGAMGCALPRELRSDVCNRHLCGQVVNALAELLDHGQSSFFLIAVDDADVPRASAFVDTQASQVMGGPV